MSAFHLCYERAPASYRSSRYGYRTPEAALRAAPTVNFVRALKYNESAYTHLAEVERGRVIRLVPLTEAS